MANINNFLNDKLITNKTIIQSKQNEKNGKKQTKFQNC